MMLKIEFLKMKMACGLIKDTNGIHFCLSYNSSIKKSYDGYIVSPIIVAGGLPNLVMLLHGIFDPSKTNFD
jgi:hypothetical protein